MTNNCNKKLRVVFMISSNLKEWGGMERVLKEYIRNRPSNIDVAIVEPIELQRERVNEDFIINNFDGVEIISIPNPFSKFAFLKKTRIGLIITESLITPVLGFLNKHFINRNFLTRIGNPDIIYLFNKSDAYSYITYKKNMLVVGSDHAWSLRNTDFFKSIQIKLIKSRLLLKTIDTFHLLPASDRLPDFIDSFILSNGVDTTSFKSKKKRTTGVRLLFYARLEECKGVPLLLDIWKEICQINGIELYIAGSGPLERSVRDIKDQNFKYLGFVNEKTLYETIAECDIFIYPSTCDTYALVVLEALSSGLLVITNKMIASSFSDFVNIGQLKIVENRRTEYIEAINNFLRQGITFDLEISKTICVNKYDWKKISEELYYNLLTSYYKKMNVQYKDIKLVKDTY